MKKLRDAQNNIINYNITLEEALEVVHGMKASAPGSNGLTIGFFKKYFYLFGQPFVDLFNDCSAILKSLFLYEELVL
jgi:hypothetical protein